MYRGKLLLLLVVSAALAEAADRPTLAVTAAIASPAKFLLRGKVAMDDVYVFNLQPNAPGRKPEWLALGAVIDGYTLSTYDHPTNTLTLKRGDETLQVPMEIAAIQSVSASPAELQQRTRDRMAQMRPALAAGQPIRGNALVLINGSVAEQPVELVIGQETRIEVGEAGALLVTPKLEADGSVAYRLSFKAAGATGQSERFPAVINTPWDGFTLNIGNSRIIAFQPADGGKS
jgi:hypothetical protein